MTRETPSYLRSHQVKFQSILDSKTPIKTFSNSPRDFTPDAVGEAMSEGFDRANHLLYVNSNGFNQLMASSRFDDFFDPITKKELLCSGYIGAIFGTYVISDACFDMDIRVNPNRPIAIYETSFIELGIKG